MPEPLGVLESGYRHIHDRRGKMHSSLWLLRRKTAKPVALEADEPERVATASRMNFSHVVITAVARDDLRDGGAQHFARTIEAVRQANPEIIIEVLVPDFNERRTPWPECWPPARTSSTITSKPSND